MSLIDMILLIVWSSYNFKNIFSKSKAYSYLLHKIVTFMCNYLYQMSNWMFMISNINKARLMIRELKNQKIRNIIFEKKNNSSKLSIHLKIFILIAICLFILNLHYLIYFNIQIRSNETRIDYKTLNKTHHFIEKNLRKSNINYTINEINHMMNKIIIKNHSIQTDVQIIFQYHLKSVKYEFFLNKIWIWIHHVLFCFIPFTVNSASILIIIKVNRNLVNLKRVRFNNQFILLFLFANTFILLNTIIYYVYIIYYNLKEYQLDSYHIQEFSQIILYVKNAFIFLVYTFTLRVYRRSILKMFTKIDKSKESIRNLKTRTQLLSNEFKKVNAFLHRDHSNKRKSTSSNQYLTVYFNNIKENMNVNINRSQRERVESNVTWIDLEFFRQNSQFTWERTNQSQTFNI